MRHPPAWDQDERDVMEPIEQLREWLYERRLDEQQTIDQLDGRAMPGAAVRLALLYERVAVLGAVLARLNELSPPTPEPDNGE